MKTKTFKRFGFTWESDYEKWIGNNGGRFYANIWKFGEIWQCAVSDSKDKSGSFWMCLQSRNSINDAMKHGIEWIDNYNKVGPPSVQQTIDDCYKNWTKLYRTRLDIVDQLFFTIGNGYDWLDGALICTDEYDQKVSESKDSLEAKALIKEMETLSERFLEIAKKTGNRKGVKKHQDFLKMSYRVTREPKIGPITEKERNKELGVKRTFYPISEDYSSICNIPENIRKDWLEFAYEAARATKLFPDFHGTQHNKKIGEKVCKELEQKYPYLSKLPKIKY